MGLTIEECIAKAEQLLADADASPSSEQAALFAMLANSYMRLAEAKRVTTTKGRT